ncbi:hypothetical protein CDAR_396401 [Caerostris darwini]|uniref:Uncharacterized protein n=1 Tax=Caerostris darwini TaxID=1538125 RepID=A0AAV4US72_9ARAC|nr:hypothetical protein CDAR_396401 [Caerostris darwini]
MRGQLWVRRDWEGEGGEEFRLKEGGGRVPSKRPQIVRQISSVPGIFVDKQSPITGKAITEGARGAKPLGVGLCTVQGVPHLAILSTFYSKSFVLSRGK